MAVALVSYSASTIDLLNQNSNVNGGQPLSGANNTTESFSLDPPQKNLWQLRDTTSLSGGTPHFNFARDVGKFLSQVPLVHESTLKSFEPSGNVSSYTLSEHTKS